MGFDDPRFFNDPEHPFVASVTWRDQGGKGKCEDIKVYYIRTNRDSFEKQAGA